MRNCPSNIILASRGDGYEVSHGVANLSCTYIRFPNSWGGPEEKLSALRSSNWLSSQFENLTNEGKRPKKLEQWQDHQRSAKYSSTIKCANSLKDKESKKYICLKTLEASFSFYALPRTKKYVEIKFTQIYGKFTDCTFVRTQKIHIFVILTIYNKYKWEDRRKTHTDSFNSVYQPCE